MSDRHEQLEKTKVAAFAFLEDAKYLRDLVNDTTPRRAYLKRASSILRRWFVEGTLQSVASPRVGSIHILAPDTAPFVASAEEQPITVFVSAGTHVFGVFLAAGMVEPGNTQRKIKDQADIHKRISFRIDEFREQEVIYFQGRWITRDDVIKYIANVGDGVHSGKAKTDTEKSIARVRHVVVFSLVDPKKYSNHPNEAQDDIGLGPGIAFNLNAVSYAGLPLQYEPDSIDCVLVEILAIIGFVLESPDVLNLEAEIRKEAKAS
jgi:hypothetical protein